MIGLRDDFYFVHHWVVKATQCIREFCYLITKSAYFLIQAEQNSIQFSSTLSYLLCKLELWLFLILIAQRGIKSLPISSPDVSLRDLSGYLYGPNHHSLSANPKDYIHGFLLAKSLWDRATPLSPLCKQRTDTQRDEGFPAGKEGPDPPGI